MEMDEFVMLVEDMRRLGHDLALSETAKLRTELEEVRRKLDAAQRHMGDVFSTFTRFDRNKSGKLDYREVKEALKSMGFDPTAREAKSIVARFDKDRSGSMELDEWAQLVGEFRRLQDRELADLRRDLNQVSELRSQLEL